MNSKNRISKISSIFCLSIILLITSTQLNAQSRHGLFNITEIGAGAGIGRIDYGQAGIHRNEGAMRRFRTTFGHYLNSKVSLGAGIGLDGYTGAKGPRYNTMPVFVDVRAYLKDTRNSPFAFADAGHTIKIGDVFTNGVFGALGIGYKKGLSRWGSVLFSASVNAHQIKDDKTLVIDYTTQETYYVRNNLLLYSLSLNVGFLIK